MGVLQNFPIAEKKSIIQIVLSVYLKTEKLDEIFSNTFQIKWFFEFSGLALTLPIENSSIIEKSLLLYDQWVSEERFPKAFYSEDKLFFIREISNHLSLVFKPREGISRDLSKSKKHIKLCLKALSIYQKLATKDLKFYDTKTREHLLCVMMGIADSFLQEKIDENHLYLQKGLCRPVLKVLFEYWLVFGTTEHTLWKLFRGLATGWVSHEATIHQWSATIYGLMDRVIGILYDNKAGTKTVTITVPHIPKEFQQSVLNLSDKQVMFTWKGYLNILGNPNNLNNPQNFEQMISGINDVVDLILTIGDESKEENSENVYLLPDKPNGDTILRIFGNWLFETVFKNRLGFDKGVSIAFTILLKILSTHFDSPLSEVNLTKFYSAIIQAFHNTEEYSQSLFSILKGSEKLFLRDHDGIFILIPHYLKIIQTVLSETTFTFVKGHSLTLLRRSSIIILKNLLCFPRLYPQLKIATITGYDKDTVQNFSFLSTIRTILLNGWSNETDPDNAVYLLWTMGLIIFESLRDRSTIPPLFLLTIQKYLCQPTDIQVKWPIKVLFTGISIIRSMEPLINQIRDCSTQTIPNLIIGLCRLIKYLLENIPNNISQDDYDQLIILILKTLSDLIIPKNWIIIYINVINEIFKIINQIIEIRQSHKSKKKKKSIIISEKIICETKYFFNKIMKLSGNFPLKSGSETLSAQITEFDLMKSYNLSENEFFKYCRFIVKNDEELITIIDEPENNQKQKKKKTMVLIRDYIGKYFWNFYFRISPDFNNNDFSEEYLTKEEIKKKPIPPKYPQAKILTKKEKGELNYRYGVDYNSKYFIPQEKYLLIKKIKSALNTQHKNENMYRFFEDQLKNVDLSIKPKKRNKNFCLEDKTNNSRMFFSNFGIFDINNEKNLKLINFNSNFIQEIQELDQTPEREQFTIGIIYVGKGQNRESNGQSIFENEEAEKDFDNFIQEIGWKINLKTHKGYKGNLQWEETGLDAIYYSNYSTEIIFHISTMLKNVSAEKKKEILLNNNQVIIVWCDDERKFNPKCIKNKNNLIYFIIRPHYTGLYSIEIIDYSEDKINYYSQLLFETSLISRAILGTLIRSSIINIFRELQLKDSNYIHPVMKRKKIIKQIIQKYSQNLNNEKFFYNFFNQKKEININLSIDPERKSPINTRKESQTEKTESNSQLDKKSSSTTNINVNDKVELNFNNNIEKEKEKEIENSIY
ncbi:hypothetical protein M0813_22571 [Anaeramoeba flamelloides]|uniref:Rap-GAP domain-containing protein n=1 Tax=Anaeramoeba flamelloides TaxID=1746091 RepID=A0ABQ8YCV5_9EUKA|nr:hypothetical protein M0813_22571 [Anaeramoeba flamelloides]